MTDKTWGRVGSAAGYVLALVVIATVILMQQRCLASQRCETAFRTHSQYIIEQMCK